MLFKEKMELFFKKYVGNWYLKYAKEQKYPLLTILRLSVSKILVQVASLFLIIVGGGIILPLMVQSNFSMFQVYKGIFLIILGIIAYTYIEKLLDLRLEVVSKQAIKKYGFARNSDFKRENTKHEFIKWFKNKFSWEQISNYIKKYPYWQNFIITFTGAIAYAIAFLAIGLHFLNSFYDVLKWFGILIAYSFFMILITYVCRLLKIKDRINDIMDGVWIGLVVYCWTPILPLFFNNTFYVALESSSLYFIFGLAILIRGHFDSKARRKK